MKSGPEVPFTSTHGDIYCTPNEKNKLLNIKFSFITLVSHSNVIRIDD